MTIAGARHHAAYTLYAFVMGLLCWLQSGTGQAAGILADLSDPDHELPKRSKMPTDRDYYPPAARAKGIEGHVLLAFSVDRKGTVINPVVLDARDEQLAAAAILYVRGMVVDVPGTWSEEADTWRRFRWMVRFKIGPSCKLADTAGPHEPLGITELVICTLKPTRIP